MSKRPPINLMELTALTANEAVSMPEATQRSPSADMPSRKPASKEGLTRAVPLDYSDSLNFKVSPSFKTRYRLCAANAQLKLNELLFEALDAWEAKKK